MLRHAPRLLSLSNWGAAGWSARQLHWGASQEQQQHDQQQHDRQTHDQQLESTVPAAGAAADGGSGGALDAAAAAAAAAATEPELGIFSAGAAALDAVHALTGLPWWASVPLCSAALKTLLLPVSLKQAVIVRTNMVLWAESHELLQQQHARARARDAAAQQQDVQPPQQQLQQQLAAAGTATAAMEQLQQWQQRLQLYHHLRRKCSVPHPSWFLVNQLLQFPVLLYTSACIRAMAGADWPGMSSEGALWFDDLTLPALQFAEGAGAQLPMGLPGLVLPLALTGIMLTSIRLGFKASGAAARHPSLAGTWLSRALAYLQPVLYCLTLASAYIKLQLPQVALLHWLTSSSFTLGLQLGLRSQRVRRLLGYSQPGAGGITGSVDPAAAAQAAAMDNPDILVVMGAKHAALQRYSEALYCLQRALQLDPRNARAHYSAGQVHALQRQWAQSEESYRQCARLAADEAARGQALYCLGVACHQQGKYVAALEAYEQAGAVPGIAHTLVLSQARTLQHLGRSEEAAVLAEEFLQSDAAKDCPDAVRDALQGLRRQR